MPERGGPARVAGRLAAFSRLVAALAMLAVTLLTVADVFLRYVFNKPIPGSGEFTGFLVGAAIFAGLGMVTHERSHIVVALLDEWVPPRGRALMAVFNHVCTVACALFFCVVLALTAARFLRTGELTFVMEWQAGYFVAVLAALAAVATAVGVAGWLAAKR